MNNIKGIIFDLDGTLVTSSLDFRAIKSEIGCPEHEDALKYIHQLPSPELRTAALQVIHRHEMNDALSAQWMPGAQEFVHRCLADDIALAIVTRNSMQSSLIKIRNNKIPINQLKTREDSPPKPDPTALLELAASFGLAKSQVMMVGDYQYDIEAAHNAEMVSCLIHRCTYPHDKKPPSHQFSGFTELSEYFFNPPSQQGTLVWT